MAPTPRPGVLLGVDVGMARVGVAASDRDGMLATPVKTLKRDVKKSSDIYVLVKLAAEREAAQIFVGLPRSMSGGETASTTMARDYARDLANALMRSGSSVDVRLVDERLTTVSAHRSLHEAGLDGRKHRAVVDQVAAVEILQQVLEMRRNGQHSPGQLAAPDIQGTGDDD
ncbi:Holliday junction resolvase RuvX [Paeniglutamicibacter sulfureus]|uniref:Holliday junction resolvase RuvX n=1 Tax=Paeniglutamicibacter sulfureus TaxID=43666 RepID=UPI002667143F|nr:Holliday junction resolvase RuvX [Paeniglutamicibacter sulfureus]MDO2936343.1 Holliday junction resolvase RuvX [Paeniglutamicibacter sulfureus]